MSSFLATRRFLDFLAFLWRNDTKEYNKILREKGIPTSLSLSLASAYLWDQTIAFAKISREMKRVERKKRHRAYFEQGTFWPCTKIDKFWWNFCEETCNNWRSNEWIFYSAGSERKKMWAWRPILWNFETFFPMCYLLSILLRRRIPPWVELCFQNWIPLYRVKIAH